MVEIWAVVDREWQVILSLSEAAQRLNLNPGTLRVQIHNGKLKGRKIGKTWTVTERELQRYSRESKRDV